MFLNIAEIFFTVHLVNRQGRGYLIQSYILNIPDRFGFFSPGPPHLQACQGVEFTTTALCYGISFICGAFRPHLRAYQGPSFAILAVGHGILFILGLVFVLWLSKPWGFLQMQRWVALLWMAIPLGPLYGLWVATKAAKGTRRSWIGPSRTANTYLKGA